MRLRARDTGTLKLFNMAHTPFWLHGLVKKTQSDYCGRPINFRVNNLFALLFSTRD